MGRVAVLRASAHLALHLAFCPAFCLALVCAAAPMTAAAQVFPSKTVRIVIGVPPGGLSDTLARGLAGELSRTWGQPVIVENRPGAADVVAADAVAKSAADGHVIYQTNGTVLLINQLLRKNLPFEAEKAFSPVIGLVRTSDVLVTRPGLGAASVQELVALARAKPGALNYGSLGIGSSTHLDVEKLSVTAGIRTTHIPYKGGVDVTKGLLAGDIDFAFNGLTSTIALIKQGQVKALAWGAEQRSPLMPDVPTLAESGYRFDTGSWLGWFVPSGTPRAVAEKLSADAGRVLATPAFRDKFVLGIGLEPLNLPVAEFATLVRDSREEYSALFRKIELKLE